MPGYLKLASLFFLALLPLKVLDAKQFGLVVGINNYAHGGTHELPNLMGAVNDAEVIADALRDTKVALNKNHILLDNKATLANFKKAWQEILEVAKPGDTVIFSFAGHGGQENETTIPFDEKDKDGMDETLMFYDFDPSDPVIGRISDDELFKLFEDASHLRILFIADSCHSGGLVRSASLKNKLPARSPGVPYKIPTTRLQHTEASQGDEGYELKHVTMITATDKDSLKVRETYIEGKPHGALSWYFAKAITGEADTDRNNILSSKEVWDFVRTKVATEMNQNQLPNLTPRSSSSEPVFSIAQLPELPIATGNKQSSPTLKVKFEGVSLKSPPKNVEVVDIDTYELLFRLDQGQVKVYNNTNDEVATLENQDLAIEKLIYKYLLLQAIDSAYNNSANPLTIELAQGAGRHSLDTTLDFSFSPGNPGFDAFIMFNLSGTGTLQFLYPYKSDPLTLDPANYPYFLKGVKVSKPLGSDDVVALFCKTPQKELLNLLMLYDQGSAPDRRAFLQAFEQDNCQVGRYSFFTQE